MNPTRWTFEPTDIMDADGRPLVVSWAEGMDLPVAFDLTDQIAEGGSVVNPVFTMWQLQNVVELVDVDVTAGTVVGSPSTNGLVVSQRITNLDRGRAYRLYVEHGAGGNRNVASTVISVGKTGA